MEVATGIALVIQLMKGIQNARSAGSETMSEADVDAAVAEIQASDSRLSDAIARAREREAGEN